LKCGFIRTARCIDWLANIVHVVKKNGTPRVCIDFRDLNQATPKDEFPMPVAEMLVDSAAGFEYLSMLDGILAKIRFILLKKTYQRLLLDVQGL